jgi:S-adenosylmethionine:tRNA-ribosyltransferase-isomerase (queuine synthetase)
MLLIWLYATKNAGKKVFAVGTTATRALETAFMDEKRKDIKGIQSYLFIQDINLKRR